MFRWSLQKASVMFCATAVAYSYSGYVALGSLLNLLAWARRVSATHFFLNFNFNLESGNRRCTHLHTRTNRHISTRKGIPPYWQSVFFTPLHHSWSFPVRANYSVSRGSRAPLRSHSAAAARLHSRSSAWAIIGKEVGLRS